MASDLSNMVDAVLDMEKHRRVVAEEALRTLARLFTPYRMIVNLVPLNERSEEELAALEASLRDSADKLAEYRRNRPAPA